MRISRDIDESVLIPTGFLFIFSVICILALGYYIYTLIKKKTNAKRVGKIAYLITFVFSIVVFVAVFILNRVVSNEISDFLGYRIDFSVIGLRGIFYVMMVLAGAGCFLGFKKNDK
jgi:uncharacterized membrane-anchored protein